ncbi:MAG: 50S ribosomal protein L15 [Methanobacteriaceae archaeon]|jgi:large subunit ribosomal protein L15|nr:50S ribosomal protein L15 [Candidatus Methanorudis spinitermitis]
MIRKKRKINKMRGSRSIGGGCSKKRRGAGHKGGRGNAGAGKHHWTQTVKFDPNHFGKYGFKRPQKKITKINPVNLSYLNAKIDQLLDEGLAIKEGNSIVIDVTEIGYNKVLGGGKLSKSFTIKSPMFSTSAEDKIQEAGGEAIKI